MRQSAEPPMRQAPNSAWNPSPSTMNEGRSESGPVFQKPGLDTSARQSLPFPSAPAQPQSSQSSAVPSKWGAPDRPASGQSSDTGGVRSIPPLPTKWTPPSGSTNPQGSPPPQGIPRPGPMPMRPPGPPAQGGPRPFIIQGPGRPGEQRPMAPPRPFGAGPPPRPPPGMGTQPGPAQPGPGQSGPRQPAPLGGPMPMPQPWKPPTQNLNKESSDSIVRGNSLSDLSSARQGTESTGPTGAAGGAGEMDWDTALDTILKTLRKDRGVGESK
jgi:translation initiation factor IF-2